MSGLLRIIGLFIIAGAFLTPLAAAGFNIASFIFGLIIYIPVGLVFIYVGELLERVKALEEQLKQYKEDKPLEEEG